MGIYYHQEPNPWLVASSFSFLVPYWMCRSHPAGPRATQSPLLALIAASAAYHATKDPVIFYLDQIAVWTFAWRTLQDGWRGGQKSWAVAAVSNTTTFVVYYYGRYTQSLLWSPEYAVATAAHMGFHIWVAAAYCLLLRVATY